MGAPAGEPLAAPVAEAAANRGMGDRTMFVPPPTPAWAPATPPPADPESTAAWTFDPDDDDELGLPGAPGATPGRGVAAAGTPGGGMPGGGTAENTMIDPASGGFGGPPPPAWADEQPPGGAPAAFGAEPLPTAGESIVPDSWYARPRKPDAQAESQATQQWTAEPSGGQPWNSDGQTWNDDAQPLAIAGTPPQQDPGMNNGMPLGAPTPDGATQVVPGPMNPGMPADEHTRLDYGSDFDQTRMDPGQFGQQTTHMGPGASMGQVGPMGMPPMHHQAGLMGPEGSIGPSGPVGPGGPMGPGGPGDPGYGDPAYAMNPAYPATPPPRSGGGVSKPLLIVVGALVTVAVAAVAFVLWPSGGDDSPEAKPSTAGAGTKQNVAQKGKLGPAQEQGAAVNELLNASAETRRGLAVGIAASGKCQGLPTAIQRFQRVAERRQNQLRRTQDLKVDKLANGERLRASLRQAFQASLEVDQALLTWAQRSRQKCKGKPRPGAAQAPGRAAAERRATLAKRQFIALWNPVAKTTGQPQRTTTGL